MKTILIIDDDDRIRTLLKQYLTIHGFNVIENADGTNIEKIITNIDLLILDIMMPVVQGIEVLKKLRNTYSSKVPVILLSAKSAVKDRILGLESGADDYLTKPFEPMELLLRINNLLQRKTQHIRIGNLFYDKLRGVLQNQQEEIVLSSTENDILNILANELNSPVKREKIIYSLKGLISERSVDVHINRIRRKLGGYNNLIKTIRHSGYMLTSD